ncbi:MAG: T9SS type A sorting domain-containing protein, partial [Bacteroidota bacterium]|nr:T9SS type A sorting domain-containing protein [Bacteroidota bacterium]
PVTPMLLNVLTYTTGVEANDVAFKTAFPYVQTPFAGTSECGGEVVGAAQPSGITKTNINSALEMAAPEIFVTTSPNPFTTKTTLRYRVETSAHVSIVVFDAQGKMVKVLSNKKQEAGIYTVDLNGSALPKGIYFVQVSKNGAVKQTIRIVKG